MAVALCATALPATAAQPMAPVVSGGYTINTYAAVGAESKPDDITRLGDTIYVGFQNGVGPLGEPAASGVNYSTIQAYALDGTPGASWNVTGKVDGLTADPAQGRLLLTTNEDGNSGFATLTPGQATPLQPYTYAGLTHGGGTDAISIYQGKIVVSASAPSSTTVPAAYSVALAGSTATLTPLFNDNATATAANGPTSGTPAPLALTDPDSNTVVPAAAPKFAGNFMLTAQGDQQLIFAANPGAPSQSLNVLSVSQPMDDTAFAAAAGQTLWVTDPANNKVDSITGPFQPGQAISTVAPNAGPAYLASLDLTTGALTAIPELNTIRPKGLLFTSAAHEGDHGDLHPDDSEG